MAPVPISEGACTLTYACRIGCVAKCRVPIVLTASSLAIQFGCYCDCDSQSTGKHDVRHFQFATSEMARDLHTILNFVHGVSV